MDSGMRVCEDCGFIDDTVVFDLDSGCHLCPKCQDYLELLDWADEMMEEYGWLEGFDGSYTGTSGYTGGSSDTFDPAPESI